MSAPPEINFEMVAGDDKVLRIPILDTNGDPYSLVAALNVRWWNAKKVSSAPIIQKSLGSGIAIEGMPVDGVVLVTLNSADTAALHGDYYYELEVIDSAGKVGTVLRGTQTVDRELIPNP